MKRSIFLAILFCLAFTSLCFALAINIDPPSVRLSIKPGDQQSGDIIVMNAGSSPIKIKAYVNDWIYANDGSKDFMKPGSSVYSCSNWIKLDPTSFDLSPKQDKKVHYVITAPKTSSGGHVSVIFFESQIGKTDVIAVSGRIGSVIYVDTEGDSLRNGSLGPITVSGSRESDKISISVPFSNKGNTFMSEKADISVFKDDKLVAGGPINPVKTLPGDTRSAVLTLEPLQEGNYKVKVQLSDNQNTFKSQVDLSIKK